MNYSTKIKLITTLLIATSLGIGYWFGVIVNELFNDDFASSEYTAPKENTIQLRDAHREIEVLKHQLSKLSEVEDNELAEQKTTQSAVTDTIQIDDELNTDDTSKPKPTILANHESELNDIEPGHWTPISTLNIQNALHQTGLLATSISELKCNPNVCLAHFKHNDDQAHYQLLLRLGSFKEFSKGFVIKSDTDNKQETVVLFPRSSQELHNKLSYQDSDYE